MKSKLFAFFLSLFACVNLFAQHQTTVNWQAPSPAPAGYNCKGAAVSGGPYTTLNSTMITGTQFVDTFVVAGTNKCYVVTALASDGTESGNSNEACAVTPPFGVTGLKTTVNSNNNVLVTWNCSADSAASYLVYRGATAGSIAQVGTSPSGTCSYQDPNLAPGTYYYTAYATLGGAKSITYPTPVATKVFPSAPTNISLTVQ